MLFLINVSLISSTKPRLSSNKNRLVSREKVIDLTREESLYLLVRIISKLVKIMNFLGKTYAIAPAEMKSSISLGNSTVNVGNNQKQVAVIT